MYTYLLPNIIILHNDFIVNLFSSHPVPSRNCTYLYKFRFEMGQKSHLFPKQQTLKPETQAGLERSDFVSVLFGQDQIANYEGGKENERERERERESVCVCICVRVCVSVLVCVSDRARESVCV